jgi:hypothetical protein
LVITRVLSQPVADYKVDTPTALAARQLEAAGIHIQPGEKVRYVHREGKRGTKECRVAAAPFIETLEGYDTKLYLELLERAVEEVMLASWPLRFPICPGFSKSRDYSIKKSEHIHGRYHGEKNFYRGH